MSTKATNKFCFRGNWYPTELVRQIACSIFDLPEEDFEQEERLQELVEAVVRGNPTRSARFIVALNKASGQ